MQRLVHSVDAIVVGVRVGVGCAGTGNSAVSRGEVVQQSGRRIPDRPTKGILAPQDVPKPIELADPLPLRQLKVLGELETSLVGPHHPQAEQDRPVARSLAEGQVANDCRTVCTIAHRRQESHKAVHQHRGMQGK